jgi:hypothetical protein
VYIGEAGMRTGVAMVLIGLKRTHMDLQKVWRGRKFVHMYLNMYKVSRGRCALFQHRGVQVHKGAQSYL